MDVLHTRLLFQEVKSRFSNISTFNKELLKATAYLLLLFYFPNLGNHRIKKQEHATTEARTQLHGGVI